MLKTIAATYGYSKEEIDLLLQDGFSLEEIEEYLF